MKTKDIKVGEVYLYREGGPNARHVTGKALVVVDEIGVRREYRTNGGWTTTARNDGIRVTKVDSPLDKKRGWSWWRNSPTTVVRASEILALWTPELAERTLADYKAVEDEEAARRVRLAAAASFSNELEQALSKLGLSSASASYTGYGEVQVRLLPDHAQKLLQLLEGTQ